MERLIDNSNQNRIDISDKIIEISQNASLKICDTLLDATPYASGEFAKIASDLISSLSSNIRFPVLSILDRLSLHHGCRLNCDYITCGKIGGYIFDVIDANEKKNFDIFDYLTVEDSIFGVWQAYLLRSVCRFLPQKDCSTASVTRFLFTQADIKALQDEQNLEIPLEVKESIGLKINYHDNLFYVSCFTWSEGYGFRKEKTEIRLHGNMVVEITGLEPEIF